MIPQAEPESKNISCPRCGVEDAPTLSPGVGPHAIRASCAHCHRHLRWISVLAPAERLARRAAALREAMLTRPASPAQLSFLQVLGDAQEPPANAAEASDRIEQLKQKGGRP